MDDSSHAVTPERAEAASEFVAIRRRRIAYWRRLLTKMQTRLGSHEVRAVLRDMERAEGVMDDSDR